ncbi:hypothetical protein BLNAU_7355 [Blattamonas nauphoetae]|uniref:MIT domain-containing protein n=1 Tax=Blattamonas nauphoetae TaxID=2049346 RepID=A0ABQ9Y1U7_9EUKA|nr:hypothetical protein BLNAU_7355 [Blattamonas nauphoetae]
MSLTRDDIDKLLFSAWEYERSGNAREAARTYNRSLFELISYRNVSPERDWPMLDKLYTDILSHYQRLCLGLERQSPGSTNDFPPIPSQTGTTGPLFVPISDSGPQNTGLLSKDETGGKYSNLQEMEEQSSENERSKSTPLITVRRSFENLGNSVSLASKKAVERVKHINQTYHITERVTTTATNVKTKIAETDEKYQITSTVKDKLSSGLEIVMDIPQRLARHNSKT